MSDSDSNSEHSEAGSDTSSNESNDVIVRVSASGIKRSAHGVARVKRSRMKKVNRHTSNHDSDCLIC